MSDSKEVHPNDVGMEYLGASKLLEEMSELTQALSKIVWPSTVPLKDRHQNIEEELADVVACVKYFLENNPKVKLKKKRVKEKLKRFQERRPLGISSQHIANAILEAKS